MRRQATRGPKPTLTEKKKRFVDEFLANGGHAANAAKAAGYSKNSANAPAKIRYDPFVVAEIAKRAKKYNNRKAQLKATEVIAKLAAIIRGNVADFVEEDLKGGLRLKPLALLTREQLAAVSEITTETVMVGDRHGKNKQPVTRMKLKLWDNNPAAVTLCRHFGLFNEGDNGGAVDRETIFARAVSAVDRILERASQEGREARLGPGAMPERPLLPIEIYPPQT